MYRRLGRPLLSKIFICYRREDSAATTGRIYDRLASYFDRAAIFKDVDSIPVGVNFHTYIDSVIQQSAVILVIIGPHWLDVDNTGRRRLDNPQDLVRTEIETALRQNVVMIPVLVQGAVMPTPEQVPASLRDLVSRNGAQVRYDPDFDGDMARLASALEIWVPLAPGHQIPALTSSLVARRARRQSRMSHVIAVISSLLVVLLLGALLLSHLPPTVGSSNNPFAGLSSSSTPPPDGTPPATALLATRTPATTTQKLTEHKQIPCTQHNSVYPLTVVLDTVTINRVNTQMIWDFTYTNPDPSNSMRVAAYMALKDPDGRETDATGPAVSNLSLTSGQSLAERAFFALSPVPGTTYQFTLGDISGTCYSPIITFTF